MAEINLLKNNNSSAVTAQDVIKKSGSFVIWSLVFVLLASVLWYGYLLWSKSSIEDSIVQVEENIAVAEQEVLQNKSRKELLVRQGQITQANTLIDNHVSWSYFLPELARVSLQSAEYVSIETNTDGTLGVVVAVPTYEDLEKYMQVFDLPEYNKQFSNVKISSISKAESDSQLSIQARLELTFDTEFVKNRF